MPTRNIIIAVANLVLTISKNTFLVAAVVTPVAVLLLTIVSIDPHFSFSFLKYFSIINPKYAQDTFEMGTRDVMQIFFVISFLLSTLMMVLKAALKKAFNLEIAVSFKTRLFIFLAVVTSTHLISLVVTKIKWGLSKESVLALVAFYIINIVAITIYLALDKVFSIIIKLTEIAKFTPNRPS